MVWTACALLLSECSYNSECFWTLCPKQEREGQGVIRFAKTAHESVAGQGSEEQSPAHLLCSPVPQVRNHFSSCIPYLLPHIAETGSKFLSKIQPEIILTAGQSQTTQPFLFSWQCWNRSSVTESCRACDVCELLLPLRVNWSTSLGPTEKGEHQLAGRTQIQIVFSY